MWWRITLLAVVCACRGDKSAPSTTDTQRPRDTGAVSDTAPWDSGQSQGFDTSGTDSGADCTEPGGFLYGDSDQDAAGSGLGVGDLPTHSVMVKEDFRSPDRR